ncbi:MAG TPA: hypothetical protein ENK86_03400 [Campylobacterales bacterium]|nr:hypothetical protein [Campylobacterales bacterium]
MSKFSPVSAVNYEIKCAYQEVVISRTDKDGKIIYCNSTFIRINGFKGASIINQPESIIRHPEMPQTIFNIIWETLQKGLPIQAVIKNKTNDNQYYWSVVDWDPQKDNTNNVVSYVSHGKQAPEQVIKIIEPLYQMMYDIEKEHGMESALTYLHAFLDEQNMTYSQYLQHLTKNRGFKCLCEFVRHSILKK